MKANSRNILLFLIWFALIVFFFTIQFLVLKNVTVEINSFISNRLFDQLTSQSNSIGWQKIDFNQLTPEQILEYVTWPNRTSCQLIHDFGGNMVKNPSGLDGQKAVCLEPVQLAPPSDNCLVYSFGINNEWSFDEAMANYGCQVYSFDPSMQVGDHDHTPAIHFFNLGLSNEKSTTPTGWNLQSLSSVYDMLKPRHGDRVIDYLKMDIENSEWDVIPQMIQSGMLDKIRQLAIEVHLHADESLSQMRDRVRMIHSLEKNGMIRFDSKLNPWSRTPFSSLNGATRPFAYEIAWYNEKFL